MPWALAALSFGMSPHGLLFDDRVDRDPLLVAEARMVGRCNAGSRPRMFCRSSRLTFSIRPTRP